MEKDIEEAVYGALYILLEKDADILKADINERSISHKLATYLEYFFNEWDVDCEYNRNHDDPKKLNLPRRDIPNDDIQARTVFPDIIIHKRKTVNNLLVIEMKKSTSQENDNFDKIKLDAFKNELNYKYAVFIVIETGNKPSIKKVDWI